MHTSRTMSRVAAAALLLTALSAPLSGQSGLRVTYGAKGVQSISYQGVSLEDIGQYPADAFHIWHIKTTDLSGNILSSGQYGWGESNSGETWNASTQIETYTFTWGSISTQFVQNGDNLNMIVTENNNSGSAIILDGVQIFPFALHFPQDPAGFSGYSQYAITTVQPGVSAADYGSGVVTSVIPNESVPLYGGWTNIGSQTYSPGMTSTAPDSLATFLPHNDYPVQPGSSFSYTVSLRFTPEGASASAADAYASFAARYPSQMTWTDKRIIGTAYLTSAPSGDPSQPGGFPTNPRRYFNDPGVNITTPAGLQAFQDRMLAQAASNVKTAQSMSAQGVITWDIEGEQYPQSTSYVCSPDQIAAVAPEMESVITDSSSAYFGQKLDDAYFKTMSGAGLKVGLCLRPQMFNLYPNGTAGQVFLTTNAAIIAELENKARYAMTRWGATIFYVDSTVDVNGGTLDPAIFQQLITDLPGLLFIPEESTPRYYAYTAPFYSFIFHTDLGTPASTYNFYPKAFGANLVNDVSASTLAAYQPQLTQAVAHGDILMGHADYFQANDSTLVSIYAAAGVTTLPAAQATPVVTWNAPSPVTYGAGLSSVQLNASANIPGSFAYTPPAGTIPGAGNNTLLVTFTPSDTVDYKSTTASVTLVVLSAAPSITWANPAAVASGTALSATQLNATANVPGSYVYSPPAGTVLAPGSYTLNVAFSPADSTDYKSAAATVPFTVNSAPAAPAQSNLTIVSPASGAIVSGTIQVTAQTTLNFDAAGSYLMVDGAEIGTRRVTQAPLNYPLDTTTLTSGPHTLQIWAHDTSNNTTISPGVVVTVLQQNSPTLTWPAPAAISYGTLLSAAQLNASTSIPGTYVYTPATGTQLSAGTVTLSVAFTPADATNYKSMTATVSLTVLPVTATITWSNPAAIPAGTPLSATQLNAAGSVPGSYTYSPAAGTVLGAGTYTLGVVFSPADATDYKGANASVSLTVLPAATTTLAWPTPAAITFGTPLSGTQLNAAAGVPGTYIYSPPAGTVLSAGTSALGVTFTPADTVTYKTSTTSVNVQVLQAAPSISWTSPAPILSGTPLSALQLSATANVPGNFAYSPAAGATFNAGAYTLSVVFTPSDKTDYATVGLSVPLTVTAPVTTSNLAILSPATGSTVSGTITIAGQVNLPLDAAGTFLMVDGAEYGTQRITYAPFLYQLDTTTLTNGPHSLQLWAHDIGNNTTISAAVQVIVEN